MSIKRIHWLIFCLISFEIYQIEGRPDSTDTVRSNKAEPSSKQDESKEAKLISSKWLPHNLLPPFKSHKKYAKRGKKLYENQRYGAAIDSYTKAINKKKSEISYFRMRGYCYLESGDPEKAVTDFEHVISQKSEDKNDRVALSRALFRCKRYKRAVDEMIASNNFDELVKLGNELYAEGSIDEALRCYTTAIDKKSDSDAEFSSLGNKLGSMNKFREAIRCYSQAIEKNPSEASYYSLRGRYHLKIEEFGLAIDDFREATKLKPNNWFDQLWLTDTLLKCGRFSEAVDETLALDDPEASVRMGMTLFSVDSFEQAIRCYDHAINKNPSNANYYNRRGKCYLEMQHFEAAISDFENAMKLNNKDQQSAYLYIRTLFDFGRFEDVAGFHVSNDKTSDVFMAILADELSFEKKFDEAMQYYDQLIERNPSQALIYEKRGNCHLKKGNWDAAKADFVKAVHLEPSKKNISSLTRAYFNFQEFEQAIEALILHDDMIELAKLGSKLFSIGKFDEALRCYTETIEKCPSESSYYKLRGKLCIEMGDFDTAISDFENTIRIDPQDADIGQSFIRPLFHHGKFDDVIEKAFSVSDNSFLIKILLEELSLSEDKFDEAVRCYTHLIGKNPRNAGLFELRGNIHLRRGNLNEAVEDFKNAMQIDSSNIEYYSLLLRVLLDSKEYDEAMEVTFGLDDIDKIVELGNTLRSKEEFKHAIQCYTRAIEKNSNEASYYKLRGKCYVDMKELELAIYNFRTGAIKDPDDDAEIRQLLIQALFDFESYEEAVQETIALEDIDELLKLGDALQSKERFEDAITCYDEAMKLDPSETSCYKLRGKCYKNMKDVDKAIRDFEECIEKNPDDMESRLLIIQTLFDSERFDQAIERSLNLGNLQILQKMAEQLQLKTKWEKAIRCYDAMIQLNPNESVYYQHRGNCYKRKKEFDVAIDNYRVALRYDPRNKKVFSLLTRTLFDLKRFEEAVEEALAFNDIDKVLELGDELYSSGVYKEAARCYSAAITERSEMAEYYRWRGHCYWKMNQLESAIKDLETAIQKIPNSLPLFDLSIKDCEMDLAEILFDAREYARAKNVLESIDSKHLRGEKLDRFESIYQKIMGITDVGEQTQREESTVVDSQAAKEERDELGNNKTDNTEK